MNHYKPFFKVFRNSAGSVFVMRMLLCLFFCCQLPLRFAQACNTTKEAFEHYSFLMPELLEPLPPNAPFLTDFETFYKKYVGAAEAQAQSNVGEWVEIFCQSVHPQDVAQVIYGLSLKEMEMLQTAVRSKRMALPPKIRNNSFAKHLKRSKCTETAAYLVFAKRCEPHVTVPANSWKTPLRNTLAMNNLIEELRPHFSKIKSNYLKLRYAYQLIRLAHYSGNYRNVLVLYEELMPQITPIESILNYWIMGHRAGALYALGEKVEAAYLFSLVFLHCKGKKESAFRSFRIESDAQWEACLRLCKTDMERANLYALRAHAQESRAVEEMIHIYDLQPQDPNLELLLVREIAKLEGDLLGLAFNDKRRQNRKGYKKPRKHVGDYVIELRAFANKCAREKRVLRPLLWKMAEGYLEFLAGDYYAATRTFEQLEPKVSDATMKTQLGAWQLALNIAIYEDIDEDIENEVANIIRRNKYYKRFPDFRDYLNDKLAYEYNRDGHPGKAFRMQYSFFDLKANPQMAIVEDLLEVCKEEEPTLLERAMISDEKGNVLTYPLMDMRGVILLGQGKPEAALQAFKDLPRSEWRRVTLFPFRDSLADCVYCTPVDSSQMYHRISLLEKIFDLEFQAKADYRNAGKYFYQLGLVHYNMSYFGSAWQAKDYFRDGSNWSYARGGIFQKAFFPYGNIEFQDVSEALFYFDKVMELSKDRELAARACFMAARCEQKRYFTSKECNYNIRSNKIPVLPDAYMHYYNLLMNDYDDTQFFKLAVRECKFFEAYVR